MIHKICSYSILLLPFIGTASRAAECFQAIPSKTITGTVRLHVSSQYASGYEDIKRVVEGGGGIDCGHTKPAWRKELLVCSNGLRVVGITKDRLCSAQEKYGSGIKRVICQLNGGAIPETDWEITDKIGQTFDDYNEDWKTDDQGPLQAQAGAGRKVSLDKLISNYGKCPASSSGKYESRGYKVLRLTAGNYNLYFVREVLKIYDPKPQPSF